MLQTRLYYEQKEDNRRRRIKEEDDAVRGKTATGPTLTDGKYKI